MTGERRSGLRVAEDRAVAVMVRLVVSEDLLLVLVDLLVEQNVVDKPLAACGELGARRHPRVRPG